jgi:hypothetical protein
MLEENGHEVLRLRDILPTDTPDPIVAKVAEEQESVLLTHDGDFKKVAPRIPKGSRTRFRKLSKIHLACEASKAKQRAKDGLSFIQFEWDIALTKLDKRMHLIIQPNGMKTHR